MKFNNVASPEVASQHLSNIYQMFNEDNRDELAWNALSHYERGAFCRLAGVGEKNSHKTLADIKDDTRRRILVTIKRVGQVANRFQNNSLPNLKYRPQGEK
jgi:hypothetical protein